MLLQQQELGEKQRIEAEKLSLQKADFARKVESDLSEERQKNVAASRKRTDDLIMSGEIDKIESDYEDCKTAAFNEYQKRWSATCAARNSPPDCQLPLELANAYENDWRESRKECETIYRIKLDSYKALHPR